MQQELIEMLDKIVEHIVICNEYDQRFSSTSYGANILEDARKLIEKAKNSAKEPAVPQGLPLHRCTNCQAIYQDQPPTQCDCMPDKQEYEVGFASFPKTPAAPSQPVTDEYAGVIAWVGDKQCKRVLTEGAIKHEHTPGVAMRNTAHQCVQEVIIATLYEKEQAE